jgi:imidazolonepropionase-like amidohydrolase
VAAGLTGLPGSARAARMPNRPAAIEDGRSANRLALDADPLAEIRDIRKLSGVLKGGRVSDSDRPAGPFSKAASW